MRSPLRSLLACALAGCALGGGALGTGGCGTSECLASCLVRLQAEGPLALPQGEPPAMTIRMCLADDCVDSELLLDTQGALFCPGDLQCETRDGRLFVERMYLLEDPALGDVVHVVVTSTATGEALLDVSVFVDRLREATVCGSTCHSAAVSWDEG